MKPQNVVLDKEDQLALRKLTDRQTAIEQFIHSAQKNAEERLIALQKDGRELWTMFGAKYSIDIKTTEWAPNSEFSELEARRMLFNG